MQRLRGVSRCDDARSCARRTTAQPQRKRRARTDGAHRAQPAPESFAQCIEKSAIGQGKQLRCRIGASAPNQRVALAVRQQRKRSLAREALERDAAARSFDRDVGDDRLLAVVPAEFDTAVGAAVGEDQQAGAHLEVFGAQGNTQRYATGIRVPAAHTSGNRLGDSRRQLPDDLRVRGHVSECRQARIGGAHCRPSESLAGHVHGLDGRIRDARPDAQALENDTAAVRHRDGPVGCLRPRANPGDRHRAAGERERKRAAHRSAASHRDVDFARLRHGRPGPRCHGWFSALPRSAPRIRKA